MTTVKQISHKCKNAKKHNMYKNCSNKCRKTSKYRQYFLPFCTAFAFFHNFYQFCKFIDTFTIFACLAFTLLITFINCLLLFIVFGLAETMLDQFENKSYFSPFLLLFTTSAQFSTIYIAFQWWAGQRTCYDFIQTMGVIRAVCDWLNCGK